MEAINIEEIDINNKINLNDSILKQYNEDKIKESTNYLSNRIEAYLNYLLNEGIKNQGKIVIERYIMKNFASVFIEENNIEHKEKKVLALKGLAIKIEEDLLKLIESNNPQAIVEENINLKKEILDEEDYQKLIKLKNKLALSFEIEIVDKLSLNNENYKPKEDIKTTPEKSQEKLNILLIGAGMFITFFTFFYFIL